MTKYSYFILICAMTAIDVILLMVSIKHKEKKAIGSFILVVVLIIVAQGFYGASLLISQPEIKYLVHEMKFLGVAYFSVAFYIMYMQLFDMKKMLSRKYLILLTIVPTISVFLAVTNNYHHLFRERLYVVENAFGSFVGVSSGLLFLPYIIYSYSVFVSVICIILKAYFRTPKIYRVQLGIMVAAAIITLLINFISISGVLFEDFGDATLISFTFAAIIQFYGLVIYKPTRMIRMARGFAVNEIKDLIVAFDHNDKFLDANISAFGFFNLNSELTRVSFLNGQLKLPDMASDVSERDIERGDSWLSVRMKRIYDEDGTFSLSVIVISDITEMKQRESVLENTANFDYLTGIANRHLYLRELKRLGDKDLPVSIVRLNICGMKAINRLHGYEAGDAVIKRVAGTLTDVGDKGFCARLGGDEFALILRNTPQEEALSVIGGIENSLSDIRLASGLAVKQSNLDNINIIDKLSMDNMYTNKLIRHSGTIGGRGE